MAILKTQITTGHPIPAINPCDLPDKKLLARYSVTSIQQRIKQYADNNKRKKQPTNLKLFATASTQNRKRIPCKLEDYFELVDWTGRISRNDKRGKIPNHCPAILQPMKLDPGSIKLPHTGIGQVPLRRFIVYYYQCLNGAAISDQI